MSDLISREDVLGAMIGQAYISGRYKLGEIWELNFDEIKEAVNRIPSAEKVGEWQIIRKGDKVIREKCMACPCCVACPDGDGYPMERRNDE